MRAFAGLLAVGTLNLLGRLPQGAVQAIGTALLPLYLPFRARTRRRLRTLSPPVGAFRYYRARLRLAQLSIRHALEIPDGHETRVEGEDALRAALASGRPVALLGWHQGPVELLHRIPARAARRPLYLMTASAFSPALSDWMTRNRARGGTRVLRPGDAAGLRAWARDGGLLAVMVDQVPGEPEDWLSLLGGRIRAPWPQRLMDWVTARDPEILVVSTRRDPGRRLSFRYDRVGADSLKSDVLRLMEAALDRAPEQYNWSYRKLRAAETPGG